MFRWSTFGVLALIMVTVGSLVLAGSGKAPPPAGWEPKPGEHFDITVQGETGLASLVSLGDAHLQKMADSLHILAGSGAAQSGDWERIKEPLANLAQRNVAALNWFALPDGSYWSVQNDEESGNLAGRDYFPKVFGGETILGELVVSTSTGKPVAIVAVPVRGEHGSVVGILGASVYLDQLSARLKRQMAIGDDVIFYSFDRTGLVALSRDSRLIFLYPKETGEEELITAFDEMLSKERGVVNYRFRGSERVLLFRRSPITGWWYAFGCIAGMRTG